MKVTYKITGLDNGVRIKPYTITIDPLTTAGQSKLDRHLQTNGDSVRWYEEVK